MTFRERLAVPRPVLLDGGLGSMLIAAGLPRGAGPERWNLERPDAVAAVHRAYVEAGSEAIHANTFGANPLRLERFGLAGNCAEINLAGIALARAAGPRFVIADIGPSGEYLPPVGQADPARWAAAFSLQGEILARAGVDAFHVETVSDLREALVILEALKTAAQGIPVLVSLTFERKKRGFFTIMGNPLGESWKALAAAGADAVGANCTLTSLDMRALAEEGRRATDLPLAIQPNAGQPRVAADRVLYEQSPEEFAADMAAVAALPVQAVGGCCGTDPHFIAALRKVLPKGGAA